MTISEVVGNEINGPDEYEMLLKDQKCVRVVNASCVVGQERNYNKQIVRVRECDGKIHLLYL